MTNNKSKKAILLFPSEMNNEPNFQVIQKLADELSENGYSVMPHIFHYLLDNTYMAKQIDILDNVDKIVIVYYTNDNPHDDLMSEADMRKRYSYVYKHIAKHPTKASIYTYNTTHGLYAGKSMSEANNQNEVLKRLDAIEKNIHALTQQINQMSEFMGDEWDVMWEKTKELLDIAINDQKEKTAPIDNTPEDLAGAKNDKNEDHMLLTSEQAADFVGCNVCVIYNRCTYGAKGNYLSYVPWGEGKRHKRFIKSELIKHFSKYPVQKRRYSSR
jgi:hypothetical protein